MIVQYHKMCSLSVICMKYPLTPFAFYVSTKNRIPEEEKKPPEDGEQSSDFWTHVSQGCWPIIIAHLIHNLALNWGQNRAPPFTWENAFSCVKYCKSALLASMYLHLWPWKKDWQTCQLKWAKNSQLNRQKVQSITKKTQLYNICR